MLSGPKRTMLQRNQVYDIMGLNLMTGKYGIEIEVEGQNLPGAIPGWEVHREGSLRGEAMEYVTRGAISDDDLPRYLSALTRELERNNADINDTYRAGTHVHYNMLQRTADSVIKAIILWTILEPLFLKYCGKNRDGNLFCVSSYDTGDMPAWLTRHYMNVERGRSVFGNVGRGKYSALNTNCLSSLGTLECRAYPSTVDPVKITEFCQIVDCILKERDDHPKTWVKKADTDPHGFLNEIFPESIVTQLEQHCVPSLLGFGAETGFLLSKIYEEYMG